jgi:hypothetical protein
MGHTWDGLFVLLNQLQRPRPRRLSVGSSVCRLRQNPWWALVQVNAGLIIHFPKTLRCDRDSELKAVPAVTEIH